MGKKLVTDVEEKKRLNFYKGLEKGERLPVNELRRLNTIYKKDYIKAVMNDNKKVNDYLE